MERSYEAADMFDAADEADKARDYQQFRDYEADRTAEDLPATYNDCTSFDQRKAFVKHMLATDDVWLTRAVARIYANQTADEQATQATVVRNNIGFAGADARRGAKLGEAAKVAIDRYNSRMTPKQCAWARQFMHRYAGQLVRIVEADKAAKRAQAQAEAMPRQCGDGLDHDHA